MVLPEVVDSFQTACTFSLGQGGGVKFMSTKKNNGGSAAAEDGCTGSSAVAIFLHTANQ